jgi:hypothetical protein
MTATMKCPICSATANVEPTHGRDVVSLSCPRCGPYSASGSAAAVLGKQTLTPQQIANASGWIREHSGIELSTNDVDFLVALRTPTVGERAAKVLSELARRHPNLGDEFNIAFGMRADANEMLPWVGVSWSVDEQAVEYLFVEVLKAHGLIGGQTSTSTGGTYLHSSFITPSGHEQIEKWRTGGSDEAIGFCAMWFTPRLLPVWTQGIEPAVRDAGYEPKRIDNVHHNNKIDDEIVALIRRSRFVVADFTGNRGGVYFEAGMAMGRDIPVVWTIRAGRFHRVHFDNRQYNFVDWSFENLADFKTRLQNRIEATLGRGPRVRRS